MTESIKTDISNAELDFARLVDLIEGPDAEKRRWAAAKLEGLNDNRAYQVATVLVGDADPIVASTARRICASPRQKAQAWKGWQRFVRPAEVKPLKDTWQLLDEVVFIIRRNLSAISYAAFLVALPKLFFICFMFFGPYVIKEFSYYVSIWSLGGALFLHQYFWRPLTWIVVGDAFLAGFADRQTRQQARQQNFNKRYMSLLISNMFVAVPFTLALSLCFHNWLTQAISLIDPVLWLVYWLVFFEMFFFVNPLVVMHDTRHPVVEGIGLRFSEGPPILRANVFFLLVSGILYIMFFSSALVSYAFLGITLQTTDIGIPQLYWLFALLVLGDCFIDPFMIGYRLLITRLCRKGNR